MTNDIDIDIEGFIGNFEIYIFTKKNNISATLSLLAPYTPIEFMDLDLLTSIEHYDPENLPCAVDKKLMIVFSVNDLNIIIHIFDDQMVIILSTRPNKTESIQTMNDYFKKFKSMASFIIIGFEMDFDFYDMGDIYQSLKEQKSNFPFILQDSEKPLVIYKDDNLDKYYEITLCKLAHELGINTPNLT
jgi:hypothetical protein